MARSGMSVDGPAQRVAPDDAVLGDVGWRSIAGLAAVVVGVLALFCIGVLLPYFADDLHRVPLADVAVGAHDPQDLWPRDDRVGRVVGFAGLLAVGVGPLVLLAVVVVGAVWLTSLWRRRPEPQRASRSLAVVVVMAGAAAALLFWLSGTGSALAAWRLD